MHRLLCLALHLSSPQRDSDCSAGPSYSHFFAARGAFVVVNDVSPEACQKAVDEIKKGGSRHRVRPRRCVLTPQCSWR